MVLGRNRLYLILFTACLAGYIWLYFNFAYAGINHSEMEVCLIKHFTNIPCPSCGSTRSVISLTKGNFLEALKINPLGYILSAIMLMAPIWIVIDVATNRETFFKFYKKIEIFLRQPHYAIPLISIVIANWIWNMIKGI